MACTPNRVRSPLVPSPEPRGNMKWFMPPTRVTGS
jgi:hypothetical protein